MNSINNTARAYQSVFTAVTESVHTSKRPVVFLEAEGKSVC